MRVSLLKAINPLKENEDLLTFLVGVVRSRSERGEGGRYCDVLQA